MSCEHCWAKAHAHPLWERDPNAAYYATMRQAEAEGWPCTKPDSEEGARARAGDYWDEVRKVDRRNDLALASSSSRADGR